MSILKTLSDVRVEEDFQATLECEFSRQIIEVKWLKVNQNQYFLWSQHRGFNGFKLTAVTLSLRVRTERS